MYIDITNHCPMSCEHCCRDFGKGTPTQRQHMDEHTYELAVDLAGDLSSSISLGGGEPLSHPKFWEFWISAMNSQCEHLWLATSGAHTKRTLTLLQLLEADYEPLLEFEHEYDFEDEYCPYPIGGKVDHITSLVSAGVVEKKFSMALSRDIFHDEIDQRVVRTAERVGIEIRDATHNVNMLGRAVETSAYTSENQSCEELHCDWQGNLSICRTHPKGGIIGHVSDSVDELGDKIMRASEIDECKHHWTDKDWSYVLGES